MDSQPTTLDWITLGIAIWGAGLSTSLAVLKRRRKLLVRAGFETARLGDIRNHAFFIVRVINTGQRAVTVSEIEWVSKDSSFTLHVFRHSKGARDLPVKVEPDEEVQMLFDVDAASNAIAGGIGGTAPTKLRVLVSGRRRAWEIELTDEIRSEAEEVLALTREANAE
jgi:hypothetical protein